MMNAQKRAVAILMSFCIPAVLAANYTLNYFYGRGAAVWDAGWFAFLSAGPLNWSLRNPTVIGGDFMAVHVSPVFILFAALHRVIASGVQGPVFFALCQAMWHGLLGAALAWCISASARRAWIVVGLAVACAGNGIVLAALGFPHFEIAMPALLVAALALALAPPQRAAWMWLVPVVLLLLIREDAGFHVAGIIGVLGLWRLRREGVLNALPCLAITLACASFSVSELVLQRVLFPNGGASLGGVYLGSPPLAHLNAHFLRMRMEHLVQYRPYIWAPLLLSIGVAAVSRDLRLLLGMLACLPWLAIAVIAVQEQAGTLTSYYGLPMTIGMVWPVLAACPALHADSVARARYLWLQAVMAALSVVLFARYGWVNHDPQPWRGFGLAWAARMGPMEAAMDCIAAHRPELEHLVVDDSVASLRLGAFNADEIHFASQFTPGEAVRVDTLIEEPGTWGEEGKQSVILHAGLVRHWQLQGTPFVIYTRRPAAEIGFVCEHEPG